MGLKGKLNPPGDKSISHRLGLVSLLARGKCRVEGFSSGADCAATLKAVQRLGVRVETKGHALILHGVEGNLKNASLNCGNSGTTIRLLMGILAGCPGKYNLDGDASLRSRPMQRVADPLGMMGARIETSGGKPPLIINGADLLGIDYTLPVASAQLKSALLLAGVQAGEETCIREASPSRDHTERLLALCGARLSRQDGQCLVKRSRLQMPESLRVPGDISSAAFFIGAATAIPGSEIICQDVLLNPTRSGFLRILQRMGVHLEMEEFGREPEPWGMIKAAYTPGLNACRISAEEIPSLIDEVPILALVASQSQGTSVFHRVGELRHKETDRLLALVTQLGALGVDIWTEGEDLLIKGPCPLKVRGDLDSYGDHRMAMTLALAGILAGAQPVIKNRQCVQISYPGFFRELKRLAA